jgi:hypothetical protein
VKTLQTLTISREGDAFVLQLRSLVPGMPGLPVEALQFGSLNETWAFLGQWFWSAATTAEMIDRFNRGER